MHDSIKWECSQDPHSMKYVKYSVAWPPATLQWRGSLKKGGSKWEANPTPQLSGTKVIQIKIQLSAGGIQCSLNFFSQRKEVRQLQWDGIFTGRRTQNSGLGTWDSNHMAAGEKLMQSQALHAICNLHPFLSFKHSHPTAPAPL